MRAGMDLSHRSGHPDARLNWRIALRRFGDLLDHLEVERPSARRRVLAQRERLPNPCRWCDVLGPYAAALV